MKVIALLLLAALIYKPVLSAPFVYEDDNWLVDLGPQARTVDWGHFPTRAVTQWTYVLQSDLQTGSADAPTFHAANVALHLLAGFLLWLVAVRIGLTPWAAWIALLVFLCHPLQSQAVAYISARSDLLMTIGILFALVCVTVDRVWAWPGVFAGLAVATMSKEIGLVGGLLVLLAALWLHRNYLADVLIVMGTAAVIWALPRLGQILEPVSREDVANQVNGVARLLSLLLVPVGFTIDPDPAAVSLIRSVLCLALVVSVLVLAWLLRTSAPMVSAGIVWAAIALAPRVLVPNGEPVHEQHAYLAMVGISLAAGSFLAASFSPRSVPNGA